MRLRNKAAVVTGQSCLSMAATPCNEEKGWNRNKNLRVTNVEKEEGKEPKIKSKEVMQLYKRRLMFENTRRRNKK